MLLNLFWNDYVEGVFSFIFLCLILRWVYVRLKWFSKRISKSVYNCIIRFTDNGMYKDLLWKVVLGILVWIINDTSNTIHQNENPSDFGWIAE